MADREQMIDYAWGCNQRMRKVGWTRWYVIMGRNGSWALESFDGVDAMDVWSMLDDKPVSPRNWPDREIKTFHNLLRWRLQKGMTEEAFARWNTQERAAKRQAFVDKERGLMV